MTHFDATNPMPPLSVEEPLSSALQRRIACVVPCYNVSRLCVPVIRDVARHVGHLIAVDDGSTDDTAHHLQTAAGVEAPGKVTVLALPRNCGKGVALIHGFRHVMRHTDCDTIVTVDGDNQHRAGDIPRLARPCLDGLADLSIAQRQFPPSVPARSRIGNNLSAAILSMAYRHTPRDTQCGLRAHTRGLLEELIPIIQGNRYDTEARILMLSLRLRKRIAQVPIPAIYHGKNESSHYRPLADSLRILWAFFVIVAVPETGVSFPQDFPMRRFES